MNEEKPEAESIKQLQDSLMEAVEFINDLKMRNEELDIRLGRVTITLEFFRKWAYQHASEDALKDFVNQLSKCADTGLSYHYDLLLEVKKETQDLVFSCTTSLDKVRIYDQDYLDVVIANFVTGMYAFIKDARQQPQVRAILKEVDTTLN